MFEYAFNLHEEGAAIRQAVTQPEAGIVTEEIAEGKAYTTSEVGDWVSEYIDSKK